MTKTRIAAFALAALLAAGAGGGMARAAEDQDSNDTAALAGMKTTLAQAIAAAEKQSGGRAVSADISHQKGHVAVEVAGPQGITTVLVDGQTGQVASLRAGGAGGEDND